MYIDTHTHLFDKQFKADIANVIATAQSVGVRYFILPNIDSESFDDMMQLATQYAGICFPTIGLHPTSVDANYRKELDFVTDKINKHKYTAIGEIGIDCYWTLEYIEQQRIVFEHQLNLAAEKNLPVIIHARESFTEIFDIFDKIKITNVRGVFHSFSGSIDDYYKIKSYGNFKIGIGGVVSFKNGHLANIVKEIDINDIVLETDSPYLAPVPYRGKRNESAYMPIIAQKLADVKQIDVNLIAEITTNNAIKLFNLKT